MKGRIWSHIQLNMLDEGSVVVSCDGGSDTYEAAMQGERIFFQSLSTGQQLSARELSEKHPEGMIHLEGARVLVDGDDLVIAFGDEPSEELLEHIAQLMGADAVMMEVEIAAAFTTHKLDAYRVEIDMKDRDVFYAFWFAPDGSQVGGPPVKLVGPEKVKAYCNFHRKRTEILELRITDESTDATVAQMVGGKFTWPQAWAEV